MNEFFQVKSHLARIRKEACEKFDNFLIIKLANDVGSLHFGKLYIESIYHEVYKIVCKQYNDDCEVFFTCCPGNIDC